jgi:hypothetical protein
MVVVMVGGVVFDGNKVRESFIFITSIMTNFANPVHATRMPICEGYSVLFY